jgi:hypothetical protein
MRSTVDTSPYDAAWAKDAKLEVKVVVRHIKRRDLEAMRDAALGANPPLCYLKPLTLDVIHACREVRKADVGVGSLSTRGRTRGCSPARSTKRRPRQSSARMAPRRPSAAARG